MPRTPDEFAQADGFLDWSAMQPFWRSDHSDTPIFSGFLIHWREFAPASPINPSPSDQPALCRRHGIKLV
jgi:hypothetical protein